MSGVTLFVVAANGLTAIVAAALLMLVLWQAPRQRANQLFAVTMLTLGCYSVANAFGRFIDDLQLDPEVTFRIAIMLFGTFTVIIFFFAAEFAQLRSTWARGLKAAGFALMLVQYVALWTGNLNKNVRPVPDQPGSYQQDWTLFGMVSSAILMVYLLVTAITLYRMDDERGRSLWPAPVLGILSAVSAIVIWPIVQIPINAFMLAGAALALGLPVLRYELFNPLAEVNDKLAQKNLDLQEANRLKSQFLANMSHELRTPLNSIIGYTELVMNGTYGALNDTQRDRLEKVIRNGHNLLNLINDVLDLNRIEAGRISLDYGPVDIGELLDSVLATVEPLATQKNLTITRDYRSAPILYGDETRLRQIVTNIIANAVKFTHQGGVSVRARTETRQLRLEFEDTGIGITPEGMSVVFAEFRQVDSSTTRQYEGTGLGMAISKRLVEMHGGRIWLDSTPGEGTTFYVTLPLDQPAGPPRRAAASTTDGAQGAAVLVIDDNRDALQMMSDTLRQAGYRVFLAHNGPEGLTRARQLQPDLITLDVMMPGMDGWQVLRALKDEPRTQHIPVVIVSIVENRPLALNLGAHDALTKPISRATLVDALRKALDASQTSAPILVVDDQPEDMAAVVEILSLQGHEVVEAEGGPQALAWLDQHVPGLVVLDLMMPDVSGFDVLAHIRHDERLAAVPVIVMTAKVLTPQERDFLQERCTALMRKGYAGSETLLAAVQRAINERQTAQPA